MSGLKRTEAIAITLAVEKFAADYCFANFHSEITKRDIDWWLLRTWADMPTLQMQRHEFKFPENWWEAVKERWAPKWYLSHYPIKYTHEVFDARLAFPEYNLEHRFGRSVSVLIDKGGKFNE